MSICNVARFTRLFSLCMVLMAEGFPIAANALEQEALITYRGVEGSLWIEVEVIPDVPVVGPNKFTVRVRNNGTREFIDNAKIMIVAYDGEAQPHYQVVALNNPINTMDYVGRLTVKSPGIWRLHITVEAPGVGSEVFVVPVDIAPQRLDPGPGGALVLLVIVTGFISGGFYLRMRSHQVLKSR
mgnify:FL=1